MQLEERKYLFDIQRAADRITRFCANKQFQQYRSDELLRSAVERQFEIIGEALSHLVRLNPEITARIPEHRRIIAFRNILIHGYATVDDQIVWGVIENYLPVLHESITAFLNDQ